jgi:diguanylate cyclase (GGDEF)-like protein
MATPNDRLPHVVGSRYAAELAKGALDMRFPPELEREYHSFYLTERRTHVRSFNVIMCALVALALLVSVLSEASRPHLAQHLRLGLIGCAYLAIVWATYSRHFERIYLGTAHLASVVIGVVGAIEVAHRVSAGEGELLAILTAYSIGLYFLAGILYRAALQANFAMVVAFAATLASNGEPPARTIALTLMLATTAAIGGVAFRYQGIRFRRTFLERGLISEMAARDGLTGLKNRRAFDEHLTRIWQQALRDRRPLALAMIDVDHFKPFNDRYGHQAGDEALQRIATIVNEFAKRPLDLAARYGGEELALILFDVSEEHATRLVEQIRVAVQELCMEHHATTAGVVTISAGLAIVRPTLERSPAGAVQLADEALYGAKRDGRNRITVLQSEYNTLSTGTFQLR